MANHRLLDQLDTVLRDRAPQEQLECSGEWSTSSRRTYIAEAQLGTGSGPFRDVVDRQWRGAITGAGPIAALAFLLVPDGLFWAKAPEISPTLSVQVSLHAYADHAIERATFAVGIGGTYLPGTPVPVSGDLAEACTVETGVLTTGRVVRLAQVHSTALFVLLFPRHLLNVGRKRVWRVREEIALALPQDIRELLTRRRAGTALRHT